MSLSPARTWSSQPNAAPLRLAPRLAHPVDVIRERPPLVLVDRVQRIRPRRALHRDAALARLKSARCVISADTIAMSSLSSQQTVSKSAHSG